ncbi:hypothetical protein [Falsibacillus pallidus]|uniref:YceG-like family protein n=1 Tax=Falsibacillus pallidus TaxID=493781 RepID=A0A370GJX5_9BACI|nr:hypothetical protein [Falsibacillus pallidus]RDI43961.1 hypothetical protein DFR59_10323 [Falsibacillus pallidus]
MDKRTTRSFAAGIIFAILAIFIIMKFFPSAIATEGKISLKESDSWVKKDTYDTLLKENSELKTELKALKNGSKESKKDAAKVITKYRLVIHSGMTTSDISSEIEKAGIVKNGDELNDYLIVHKYGQILQIGEYDLTSDMDFEQIAKIITKT